LPLTAPAATSAASFLIVFTDHVPRGLVAPGIHRPLTRGHHRSATSAAGIFPQATPARRILATSRATASS
jgi:hypothetical protein